MYFFVEDTEGKPITENIEQEGRVRLFESFDLLIDFYDSLGRTDIAVNSIEKFKLGVFCNSIDKKTGGEYTKGLSVVLSNGSGFDLIYRRM